MLNIFKSVKKSIFSELKKINTQKKVDLVKPYFKKKQSVLDFGCGDLELAEDLKKELPYLSITGVDVVDFGKNPKKVKFVCYDGKKLPFENMSFDTVLAFNVFHHCDELDLAFFECVRIAKKRLLIIEPVFRTVLEIPLMKIMDCIYNCWKEKKITLPFDFYSEEEWLKIFSKNSLKVLTNHDLKNLFLVPIGKEKLFEISKK